MFRPFCMALSCTLLFGGFSAFSEAEHPERYPWAEIRRDILPGVNETFDGMANWQWTDTGGENGKVTTLPDGLKWDITVRKTPDWPSITVLPDPLVDFRGGVLRFRLRACRKGGGECPVRVIMNGEDAQINVALSPTPKGDGQWRDYEFDPGDHTWQRKVRKIHLYVSTDQYEMGEDFSFEISGIRRGVAKRDFVPLPKGQAGVSLWLGRRGDSSDSMVLVREGAAGLDATLHVENGMGRDLPPDALVRFRLRNVFTGQDTVVDMPLGTRIPDGVKAKVTLRPSIAGLKGGYYHALADVLLDGQSILDIRKGSDDFYVRTKGESDAEMVLAIRLGMSNWIIDRVHGGGMAYTRIAIPHTYDPYDADRASYSRFIRLFVPDTEKVCEGYEAGLTGLAIAADAYRLTGDAVRERFAERLMWNCCEAMFTMQDACGGTLTIVNDLMSIDGYGSGLKGERHDWRYHADQTGEWMRALTYVGRYYLKSGERAKLRTLLSRIMKAGSFLIANCRQDSDGIPGVLRDFQIQLNSDGTFSREAYQQEDRQCDVYQPRLVAGLAYAASLMQKAGESVPTEWWTSFDATVRWMNAKMKEDGWFDWQCSDFVENGCHTFLGNIYAGEALFGIGVASRLAGRADEAAVAFAAAHRAYRYVTDSCVVRGERYQPYPEFWTGPYLYWLFSDWRGTVGKDKVFSEWCATLDRTWRVERGWKDFLRVPNYNCGRAFNNGMINVAILGYLGLRVMEERGVQWKSFLE